MARYLNFNETKDTGKTKCWDVKSLDGLKLGEIKWYASWRKYCFFTMPNCIFDIKCIKEITEFISIQTQLRDGRT